MGGSAFQCERGGKAKKYPTPAPRPPRVGGTWRGGWAAALPGRACDGEGLVPASQQLLLVVGEGRCTTCVHSRAGRAYVCVYV